MDEKQRLIASLKDTYDELLALVEGVDPEMQVNPETDWRIRDIIGHLAVWDRESARSIRAFQAGGEYSIPNFEEDSFNNQELKDHRDQSTASVFESWKQERGEFIAAVEDMPAEQFGAEFLYPWGGEYGNVSTIVDYMTGHDVEHRVEIERVLEG